MNSTKQIALFVGVVLLSLTVHSQNIRLMSYNIGSSDWMGNRDSVIARIEFNDPDVFCAIEATGNKRPFLETTLTNYNLLQTFGSTPNISESHIFYRKNMFTVIDSGFVQMDTYGGYTGPDRYVNWARFKNDPSGQEFLVYASHFVFVFPANPDSATIGQYRHANGMVMLMNQHISLDIPMITAGDFNADSSKDVMQFLQHQTPITYYSTTITNPIGLNDSWYMANPSVNKPETLSNGNGRIDWILTTPNTNVIRALIDDQGENSLGDFPSDHLPLMITFNLPNTTSINEISNGSASLAFPNPFQEYIQFEIGSDLPGRISVQIVDVTGRTIKDTKVTISNAENQQVRIDLSDLVDGVYFYSLRTSDQLHTGTIIKGIE